MSCLEHEFACDILAETYLACRIAQASAFMECCASGLPDSKSVLYSIVLLPLLIGIAHAASRLGAVNRS